MAWWEKDDRDQEPPAVAGSGQVDFVSGRKAAWIRLVRALAFVKAFRTFSTEEIEAERIPNSNKYPLYIEPKEASARQGGLNGLLSLLQKTAPAFAASVPALDDPPEGNTALYGVWYFDQVSGERTLSSELTDNPFAAEMNTPSDTLPQNYRLGRVLVPTNSFHWRFEGKGPSTATRVAVGVDAEHLDSRKVEIITGNGSLKARFPCLDGTVGSDDKPLELTVVRYEITINSAGDPDGPEELRDLGEFSIVLWLRDDPRVMEIASATRVLGDDGRQFDGMDCIWYEVRSALAYEKDFAGVAGVGFSPWNIENVKGQKLLLEGDAVVGFGEINLAPTATVTPQRNTEQSGHTPGR